MLTLPMSISSRPERQLSSVVLPQPLGPMIATISPRSTVRLTASECFDGHPTGIVGLVYVDRPDNWGWGLRRHAGGFTGSNLLLGSASTLRECERFSQLAGPGLRPFQSVDDRRAHRFGIDGGLALASDVGGAEAVAQHALDSRLDRRRSR